MQHQLNSKKHLEQNQFRLLKATYYGSTSDKCIVILYYITSFGRYLNTLPTAWFRLLITFANSLDPDQARHFVGYDLDPICLTL